MPYDSAPPPPPPRPLAAQSSKRSPRYRPVHEVSYDHVDYTTDLGLVDIDHLIAAAEAAGCFTFDLETTGLDPLNDRIEGIAFYIPASERYPAVRAWYPFVPNTFLVFDKTGKLMDLRPPLNQRETFERLRPLFSNTKLVAIAHHGKFDAAFLRFSSCADSAIEIEAILADSMLCDYVADERLRRYGLKIRVKQVFGVDMTTYEEAVRGQTFLPCFNQKPLAIYAMDDTEWTHRLHENALASIRRQLPTPDRPPQRPVELRIGRTLSTLEALYWGIVLPVSRVIMEMQTTGVPMDYRHLRSVEERLEKKKAELHDRIEAFLGWPLNVRSAEESAAALFDPPPDGLGLPTMGVPIGKSGIPSTSDKVIRRFVRFHPLVQDLLEVRSIETVLSSYARKMLKLTRESHDGRLRSGINQTGTKIGRLSMSKPINSQSMPRDKKLIRMAFCAHLPDDPDPRIVLIGGDYAQIELRVAASLAKEENMLAVYRMGKFCQAENGAPCDRFTWHECKDCGATAPPIELPDGKHCPKCASTNLEHQMRCSHVDLHQRTAEMVNVKRNPLAKCLDGSTLLLAARGADEMRPQTIESLVGGIEPGEHRPITGSLFVDRGVGNSQWAPATSALKRHSRPTKIVVTKRAIVVATNDHRFQVIGDYASLDPATLGYEHVPGYSLVEAQHLEKGMKLPVAKMGEAALQGGDEWHQQRKPQVVRLNPFTKEIGDGPASITLDEDWAYFAGLFQGDGSASGNACTITHGHTDEYEAWRQVVRAACDKIGLPTTVSGDKRSTRLGSRVVRRYLEGLNLCKEVGDSGEKTMRVPQWVLDGGPSIQWSYIAGLFDTDGTIGSKIAGTASLTTKYPEFASQIAFLLRYLGMPILVQPGFNKPYERWYYTIHVLGEGLERFQRYCPLRHTGKAVKLQERNETIKRRCAPADDEVLLVLDGGERTVYDFQIETADHLYLQGGLVGHNNLNFGTLYRMAAPKFCIYADLFDADGNPMVSYAASILTGWHSAYPGIAIFHQFVEEMLPRTNWVATSIAGRRRRLDKEAQINPYRAVTQGIQFKVSGSAQDLIQIAMMRNMEERDRRVRNSRPAERKLWEQWRALLQVHDELIYQAPVEIAEECAGIFKHNMETADGGALGVPLVCDPRIGRSWDDIH